MGLVISVVSILVQFVAAIIALRLAYRTRLFPAVILALAVLGLGLQWVFALSQRITFDRPIRIETGIITLIISVLMLVGLLGLRRWLKLSKNIDLNENTNPNPGFRFGLAKFSIILGSLMMIVSGVIGIWAFNMSREVVVQSFYKQNLALAHSIVFQAELQYGNGSDDELIRLASEAWQRVGKSEPDVYMCVINGEGELSLHTENPDKAGNDVASMLVHSDLPSGPKTFDEILKARKDWVGCFMPPSGQREIVAVAHALKYDSMIVIHVPISVVDALVDSTAMPWIIVLAFAALLLLPLSFGLLYWAYSAALIQQQRVIAKRTESESRNKLVTDALPVCISYFDNELKYLFANANYRNWYGRDPKDILGLHVTELIGDSFDISRPYTERALQGETVEFDVPIAFADGQFHDVHALFVPHIDDDGEVKGFYSLSEDVTSRKTTDGKLLFQAKLLQSVHEAIIATDMEGNIQYWGGGAQALYGYPAEEVMGQPIAEVACSHMDGEDFKSIMLQVVEHGYWQEECESLHTDGSRFWVEAHINLITDADEKPAGLVIINREISKRKRYEGELTEANHRFNQISENIDEVFFLLEIKAPGDFHVLYVNSAFERIWQRTAEELYQDIGVLSDCIHPEDQERVTIAFEKFLNGDGSENYISEYRLIMKDESIRTVFVKANLIKDEHGVYSSAAGTVSDITDLKEKEKALRESRMQMDAFFVSSPAGLAIFDDQLRYVKINEALAGINGVSVSGHLGKTARQIMPELAPTIEPMLQNVLTEGVSYFNVEVEGETPKEPGVMRQWVASYFPIHLNDGNGGEVGVVVIETTRRKQAERALHESRMQLDAFFVSSPTGLAIIDDQLRYVKINEALAGINGVSVSGHLGKTARQIMPELAPVIEPMFQNVLTKGISYFNVEVDGETPREPGVMRQWMVSYFPIQWGDGNGNAVGVVVIDTTRRKQAEDELRVSNRALKVLSEFHKMLSLVTVVSDLLDSLCAILVESGGYRLAWIGFAECDEDKTVRPVAQMGFGEGYLDTINITYADTEYGRGPTGTAIRERRPVVANNILTDPHFSPWREKALEYGYASSIAIPLMADETVLGALSIYSAEPDAFHEGESALLVQLANELAYGLMGMRDREDRRRAENNLRKSSELLKAVYEANLDLQFVLDPDGTILSYHTPDDGDLYLPSEDFVGRKMQEVLPAEPAAQFQAAIKAAHANDSLEVIEYTLPMPGGDRHYEGRIVSLPDQQLVATVRDITERKRSEEQLLISNRVLDAIRSIQNQFIDAGRSEASTFELLLQRVLGLTESEYGFIGTVLQDAKGKPYIKTLAITNVSWDDVSSGVYHENSSVGIEFSNLKSLFGAVLVSGAPVITNGPTPDSVNGELPEGHPALNALMGIPLMSHNKMIGMIGIANKPGGYNKTVLDYLAPLLGSCEQLLAALLAENEQDQLKGQLQQSQKLESIGVLAGGVAHEINNPINVIMNYAQLIKDRLAPESPLHEFAEEISHETERVAKIVSNLLAFSRQENVLHLPTHINDIVNDTIALIRTVIRHDKIALEIDMPEDLPLVVCSSQQIQQVLLNLITNARDALNERYPGRDPDKIMKVFVKPFEKEGRPWIRMTVEDHGAGIADDVRARMFDPFFTTKDKTMGTGLGLSISHGIIKDHVGELRVDSEPGEYTRFHVELPVEGEKTSDKNSEGA